MKQDEFNDIGFKEFPDLPPEYSPTQDSEFSSYEDNPNKRKTSLNSTKTKNDEISAGEGKTSSGPKIKVDKDAGEGTNVTTTSANTATTAATVTSTVAVAASTVAVVTVSTLVGINIVHESNASVEFSRLVMAHNELSYALNLRNTKEDEEPFVLKVENSNYSNRHELFEGENEGFFEGLTPNETYTIEVSQDVLGGKTIYQESFKFEAAEPMESYFWSIDINPQANFEERTFEVTLSYEDPGDNFSNFSLILQAQERDPVTFALEKTFDTQTISFNEFEIEEGLVYDYTLHYLNKGEEVIYEGESIEFHSSYVSEATITDVYWGWYAYYPTGESELAIVYEDNEDVLTDFYFNIGREYSEESDYLSIPLEKMEEYQTFNLQELELYDETETFHAYISYSNGAEELQYDLGTGAIENTAESTFESIYIDNEFSYSNQTFFVTLTYTDENDYFSNFVLTLSEETMGSFNFALEKTLETQTLEIPEGMELDYAGTAMNYSLSYNDARYEEAIVTEGALTFVDSSYTPSESVVTNLDFEPNINFKTGEFDLAIDYSDETNILDNFQFILNDQETGSSYSFSLQKSTERQYFRFRELVVNELMYDSFTYQLTYEKEGKINEFVTSGSFTFTNNGTSEFIDIVSPYYLYNNYFFMRFDMVDDKEIYSSEHIIISGTDGSTIIDTYLGQSGELSGEWNMIYAEGLSAGTTYYLTATLSEYEDDGTDNGVEKILTVVDNREITFTDGSAYSRIDAIRLDTLSIEASYPHVGITPYFANITELTDFKFLFRFSDTDIVEIPYDLADFPNLGNYIDLDFSTVMTTEEFSSFTEKVNSNVVDIGFSYNDSNGDSHSSYDYEDVFFTVS